jgi:sugar O-acyltransferase (sialic acid O-acetyltransferase NeuD family)
MAELTDDLVVVAASGLGRETIEAARAQGTYRVRAILDDDPRRTGAYESGVEVVGGIDALARFPAARVVICVGKGSSRANLAARLALPDERYATVIHPSVDVPGSCRIGAGSVLLAGSVLTASVTIGQHVVLMPRVVLTHDDVVADFATLCAGATFGGAVHIGPRSYIGMSASVREGCRIGADALVGMGAVVLSDVAEADTVVGNPAAPLIREHLAGAR